MNKFIPVAVTDRSVTFVIDGVPFTVGSDHVNYAKVRATIKDVMQEQAMLEPATDATVARLKRLVALDTFVAELTHGRVQIGGGVVRVDGEEVHNAITARMISMLREGFDVTILMTFLDRLQKNPNQRVRDGLFHWLEAGNMPLTPDGCFIAYKFVRNDYTDSYTGKIDNKIGAVIPRIDFNHINTNSERTCAESGYHFCSYGYISGGHYDHIMEVKVAPEDVASFPRSEEHKGRCVFYEVVGEMQEEHKSTAREDRPLEDLSVAVKVGTYDSGVAVPESGQAPSKLAKQAKEVKDKPATPAETRARLKAAKGAGVGQWTVAKLKKLVAKVGQRAASRETGIPRATLQDRIKGK